MKVLLYEIVEWIAKFHNYFMRINDKFEYQFSDKELHFLVIGALGMGFIFVVYPIFKWLAKRNHIMTIAWIYVFTLIIVITFAIEIGQKVTGTGVMEFADIMFGVVGFLVMYMVFAICRGIWHLIRNALKASKQTHQDNKQIEVEENETEEMEDFEIKIDFEDDDVEWFGRDKS